MSLLVIRNGTVYDPTNGVDGQVRDIWIEGGKVVSQHLRVWHRARKVFARDETKLLPASLSTT